MRVLQISITDTAGVPYRLNTTYRAMEIDCNLVSFIVNCFPGDIVAPSAAEFLRLIEAADVIHFHGMVAYYHFRHLLKPDKHFLVHFHGCPERSSGLKPDFPHVLATPDLIPEFPDGIFIPNLILPEELPSTTPYENGPIRVFKSPSVHQKHYDVLEKFMTAFTSRLKGKVEFVAPQNILVHRDLSQMRATCHLSFDHMHGYYGLESLEALCQGLIVINGSSDHTLDANANFLGERPPFELARTPSELGNKLLSLLQTGLRSPADFRALQARGPEYIKHSHSQEVIASAWLSLYKALICGDRQSIDEMRNKTDMTVTVEPSLEADPSYVVKQVVAHEGTHIHESDPGRGQFLESLIDLFPAPVDHLLEIGCHNGMETAKLARIADRITGIELGQEYLLESLERDIPRFSSLRMDMHHLGFPAGTFDAVFANNVIEHAHDPHLVIAEIYRVLKPGGMLIAAVPPDALGNYEIPYHLWKATPRQIFNAFFPFDRNLHVWDVRNLGIPSPASDWKMVVVVGTIANYDKCLEV